MSDAYADVDGAVELVDLDDIRDAADRIGDLALHTPLIPLPHPDDADRTLTCKAESLQPTGAFKMRGAYNAILQDLDRARTTGVVAQSSGNHGRAVAWVARRLGLRAVIVMPGAAPASKVAAVREQGAEVELVPAGRRDVRPRELVEQHGFAYVPPYDDPRIVAGQGTAGLELATDFPDLELLLVPVSGGGLISGVATAVKSLRPAVAVIGVEPELAADAQQSLREDRRVEWSTDQTYRTIADGLRTTSVGVLPFAHIRRYVDDIITVTEEQIRAAMRHLVLAGRLVVEPSGAVATAAWLHDLVGTSNTTAAIVSGGSVEPSLLAEVVTGKRVVGDGEPARSGDSDD